MTFEQEFQRRLLLLMRTRYPDAALPDGTHVAVSMTTQGYDTSGYYSEIDLIAGDWGIEYADLGELIRDLDGIMAARVPADTRTIEQFLADSDEERARAGTPDSLDDLRAAATAAEDDL